ncbi:hypothetical protein Ddye_028776 [Dipteronia dyeriana]|uniref:Uncharacterized protein n=1 Tax=Dipteronia dyeriana TaxID=168575 RepID=A0AAD9TD71_9ROSI|nr:hypothetical protein Ddye_028776 [Dipteronia dyeriana]
MKNLEPAADQSSTTTNGIVPRQLLDKRPLPNRLMMMLLFYNSNRPMSRKLLDLEYATSVTAKMLKGKVVLGLVDVYESARGFFIRHYPTMCSIFTGRNPTTCSSIFDVLQVDIVIMYITFVL